MNHEQLPSLDAYSPGEIATKISALGITKCDMPALQTLILSVLAGAFISFGAMFYTVTMTGAGTSLGPMRLLGGVAFSLGFILVVVAGAELFTGNNLIVMAWADGKVRTAALMRNWALVYAGNLLGALGSALLFYLSGCLSLASRGVADTAIAIATAKVSLPFEQIVVRGILCNALVCLAVWLCSAARSVTDKVLATVFPIAAFVALGFEHSVANMYFIPIGILAAIDAGTIAPADAWGGALGVFGFARNLAAATAGNVIGGSVFVALIFYLIYVRGRGKGM